MGAWKRRQVSQIEAMEPVLLSLCLGDEFILPFRALCSYPHTLLSLVPSFGEGGLTRATKNLQHSGFLPQVGLSSEAKLGMAPVLTPSQTKRHTLEESSHTQSRKIYLSSTLWGNVHHVSAGWSSTSCQGCVFIFLDAHSVTSPCLFMHAGGNNTCSYLGSTIFIKLLPVFCKWDTKCDFKNWCETLKKTKNSCQ